MPSNFDGARTLCIILDGIDRSKFRLPQTLTSSKDFAGFTMRPTFDTYGALAHGEAAFLFQSGPETAKDSNYCTEVYTHILDVLIRERGLDSRRLELVLPCDNTVREVKNNTTTRQLAMWTSLHRLHRAELRSLVTGHSHEDIDAWFGALTYHLERELELHTPLQFIRSLQKFMDSSRPYEPLKRAVQVHRVRNWSLSAFQKDFCWGDVFLSVPREIPVRRLFAAPSFYSRRTYLHIAFQGAHLGGISGPGAPHVFAFDRVADAGALLLHYVYGFVSPERLKVEGHKGEPSIISPLLYPVNLTLLVLLEVGYKLLGARCS